MLHALLLLEKIALVGGLVHSLVPGQAPHPATILLDRGLIEAVGPDVKIPADARRVDVTGLHIVPGLIDGMVSFDPDYDRLYLSNGVTCVRETGANLTQIVAERDTLARERNPGPSLWIAGAVIDGNPPATRSATVMVSADEAEEKGKRLIDPEAPFHIDYFSTFVGLPEPAWRKLIELGHAQQRPVQLWGPLPRGITLEQALAAGQDGLFHLDALLPPGKDWNQISDEELAAIAKRVGQSKLAVTPTLALYAKRLIAPPENAPQLAYLGPIQVAIWLADREKRRAFFTTNPDKVAEGAAAFGKQAKLVRLLHENKVALVPGSGSGLAPWLFPGEALLDELSLWVASAGFSPSEAVRAATQASAQRLGMSAQRGTLEAGKSADLVITKGDPEVDLKLYHQPEYVVVRGRVLSAAELEALRGDLEARQKRLQTLCFQPLQLPAPSAPAGELVLSGMVETRYAGQRISGERFAVGRMSDGTLVFSTHMLTFGSASTADTECDVVQKVLDGRLIELGMTVTSGPRVVTIQGTLAGGQLNVESRLNGVFQKSDHVRERVPFVEFGSVATDLILGQSVQPSTFTALFLQDFDLCRGEFMLAVEPETGRHLVRSVIGGRVVDYAADGAPKTCIYESGRGDLTRTLLEDVPVGAGLPVPKKQNPPAAPAGDPAKNGAGAPGATKPGPK